MTYDTTVTVTIGPYPAAYGGGMPREGPVHAQQNTPGSYGLAWCGMRSQFRHRVGPGTADQVTCPKCLRALTRGRPYAVGR